MNTVTDRYDRATFLFAAGDYIEASRALAALVAEEPGSSALRLLLARAYYHSAQLGRAEQELRTLVAENPVDVYARLLLGRTLQRLSRHDDAAAHLRLAEAMSPAA
ncbi:tetratricopeptide repeat protein [Pseudonocardia sp. KRD291]|uniref:tetratricopeptide repeat protein n=1 Tax=Pseudonocardia sp. KRD291 TaxID=2792007 RepID=UPI001C4A2FD6|nr:tetratricopeptide repeat protein [Pseudonocardia sp. KRD291]MBW0103847.1 tetratricopeptide repeat protein [Pseudonocardia sp. KRD291]